MAFSPDGMRIASLEMGILTLWDATTGAELLSFGDSDFDGGNVNTVTFSPDGAHILYMTSSGIMLWDAATGAKLLTLSEHDNWRFTAAAFSPTGRYIYFSTRDGVIDVWDSGINPDPALALPGELSVPVGSSAQITPLSAKAKSWSSADNAIASVDENGEVTGMAPGNVNVAARDADGLPHTLVVRVTADNAADAASFGRAIVIAGGGAHSLNTLFPYSNELAGRMYGLLRSRGFTDDEIYYFNPAAFQDIDDNGLDDGITHYELLDPWNELNAAMDEIAPALLPGQQLVFYLHGHADNRGSSPTLRLNQTSEISTAQLAQILARVPEHAQQVIILDTCHSGAFLQALAGHPRRIVLTSADADSKAWNPRQENFSNVFINSARRGMNLNEAFLEAERVIKGDPEQFAGQRPLMDDDGDGFYSTFTEGRTAAGIWLGKPGISASAPPAITKIRPPWQPYPDDVQLWAEIFPTDDHIRKVRAILRHVADSPYESVLYQGEITDYNRIELAFYYNPQQNRWETQAAAFPKKTGRWRVMYEARDMDGIWSLPLTGEVIVTQSPQAAFSMEPDLAEASRPVTFDASASMDPDGTISDYRWSMAGYIETLEKVALRLGVDFTQPITTISLWYFIVFHFDFI
ncbi:MAG: hypothetical protein GY862_31210 [Gammaproteobacteria bacterium]|nr:hypothetical protein [Gammaproteobacteria bacterium]